MSTLDWICLATIVLLGTAGQLALKYALRNDSHAKAGLRIWLSPAMVTWIICYTATTALWLFALRSVPLSQAFPILGLQFALIPMAARHFLNEDVSPLQWAGIVVIVLGVALVGQS